MSLREKAEKELAGRIGMVNPFDTITANILTATEAVALRALREIDSFIKKIESVSEQF